MGQLQTLDECFYRHVDSSAGPDACWIWTGKRAPRPWDYGVVGSHAHGERRAHRLAWTLVHGPIPKGKVICHTCDSPPCVNPKHLFLGEQLDNMRDMCRKGRHAPRPEKCRHIKLTIEQVIEIKRLLVEGTSRRALAQRFVVSVGAIDRIAQGKVWKNVDLP